MKQFLSFLTLLVFGLAACNSGKTNKDAAATDTLAMKDTTHAMPMASADIDPLPEVPADANVFFKNLKQGETVISPLTVEMGVTGMSVDSAGIIRQKSGHFHILIDAEDSIPAGVVIGKDSAHLHFGNAQEKTSLSLMPGKHRLALQFADGLHRSYGGKLATTVSIDVKK
ncbi:MAG: DUF4399 domain-containing protein [Sphingobacteriales bacterium]|nr:DUF4399 domain-containing protein [Sphingobacteriales bacterium]